MTYGQFKNRVLQLIFSYTIAGDNIELSYNNQEDYVKMIPALLNSCQSYIYQIKKIEDSILLRDLDSEDMDNGLKLYHLPDDCLKMKPGLIIPRGRHPKLGPAFERYNDYRLFGGDKIICDAHLPDTTILEYQKRGLPIPENPPDSYVLRNPEEVNDIMPFYVAAFVVMYDDAFRYSALYNEFETRLQRLMPTPAYAEVNDTFDVYAGFSGGDFWWHM